MSKKLAIRGHATRGKEVIELLEMMGGNTFNSCMKIAYSNRVYYIGNNNAISWDYIGPEEIDKYEIFTLEEFLEKYPFKVGDKVVDCYGDPITIKSMEWSEDCETMVYDFKDSVIVLAAEDLLKYNAGILADKEIITPTPDITADVTDKNNCGIQCPDGYEFYDENGNLIGTKVMMRPKKPVYPKTYVECCDVLGVTVENLSNFIFEDFRLKVTHTFSNSNEYYINLFKNFFELKLCYDAYCKIAGEQMGLGKTWKPDWLDEKTKYTIKAYQNRIIKDKVLRTNCFLVFPTEEMRDTFYDNFKDLIEQCKELL